MYTLEIISYCRMADGPNKTLVPRFKIGDAVAWERANGEQWCGLIVNDIHFVRNSCPHIRITARCGHRMVEGCQRFFRMEETPGRIGALNHHVPDLDSETDF